jgi:hypothetical protein
MQRIASQNCSYFILQSSTSPFQKLPNTACSGWWVRAAFSSRLLAEGASLARAVQPLPPPLTLTVRQPVAKNKVVFESQSLFFVFAVDRHFG